MKSCFARNFLPCFYHKKKARTDGAGREVKKGRPCAAVLLHLSDVPILGFRQEDQADDEAHRSDHDRIPQAGVDIPGRCHDGEHGRRQEAAKPAVADVIRQRQTAVADSGRKQFHQPGGDRRVHHSDVDHQDGQQDDRHGVIDFRRIRLWPGSRAW